MANEEDKTIVSSGDGKEPEEGAPKKGGNKLILFGGIGLGAIVIGVVLALFVIGPMMSSPEGDATDTSEIDAAHSGDGEQAEAKKPKKKKKKTEEGEETTSIYAIENVVINPAGTGGSRFLSVSISFELESAELHKEFEVREAIIRDALITILSSKTVAQLTDAKQKEITRYQIKKRVSQLMETEELAGVYYTDFVLQ